MFFPSESDAIHQIKALQWLIYCSFYQAQLSCKFFLNQITKDSCYLIYTLYGWFTYPSIALSIRVIIPPVSKIDHLSHWTHSDSDKDKLSSYLTTTLIDSSSWVSCWAEGIGIFLFLTQTTVKYTPITNILHHMRPTQDTHFVH